MNIIPESKSLEKILTGLETKYIVPDYQRDYSWSVNEVETLWTDIVISHEQQSEYFMGTIVLKKHQKETDTFDIVDGQQRLATFSMLFYVLASLGESFSSNPDILRQVERNPASMDLSNKIAKIARARLREPSEPDNYYLRLNKKDNDLFEYIIRNEKKDSFSVDDAAYKINKNDNRLLKTKKTFIKKIIDEFTGENALKDIYTTLVHVVKKLKFITIEVETDYDAFLLFESLNSKGMDLSVADLLKNKILMKANGNEEQSELLLNNWESMISSIESSRLSPVDFLRVYWEAIQGSNITKKELYKHIGAHIDLSEDIVSFSKDLKETAADFSSYASSELFFPTCVNYSGKEKYLSYCGEINTLKYTTCLPLLMYTYRFRSDFMDVMARLSLSFLFRWITICDYSVGGAKKVFDEVIRRLIAGDSNEEAIQPFFSQHDKIGDDPFIVAMRQFKAQDNQIAKYILSKCYLYDNKMQSIPNYNEVHLEHVLPQSTILWEKDEHFILPKGTFAKDYVYNIGNLTLLHKQINQSIKNKVFSDKCNHYEDSIFPETKNIFELSRNGNYWNVEIIEQRGNDIARQAPFIWPLSCN
ncbi:DUF262 domain-containing protein [Citrobacter sp. AN-PRR1]|uniref:DUF262 domain-containing protein n=2 Tax=Enterobacteriaceae TaxID=543 RepID=UPI001B3241D1|nr:DUF262 domain-containing protein [Citrobacter sp. AN-PRR1]MBP5853664.1 DUF262 domain-containing protein [Citrobacter sp. AN-PRR1]